MTNFTQVLKPFIQLLPPYLIIITAIFILFPSVVSICLRLALHKRLVFLEKRINRLISRGDRGKQPEIINELERRFKEASANLDRVNTAALIDQVYSNEKLWLISFEQIDYFCRTLPNLLLAFGLLGTFLGITINLTSLSQAINQISTSDISRLVQEIQQPLKGMGIAFTTSLIGILLSALLTVVNLLKNTSVAKYKLISTIEDYLDNIYLPKVQGNNRLDKAVDRLVFEFKDFLGRFGTTVRSAVESSLGEKIQQIVDANKQASQLACQVYSGFQESSGTIATCANDLKFAVSAFENAVATVVINIDKYQQVTQVFENSQFPQKLLNATTDLANTQSNFSQSASSLANTAQSIEMAVAELQTSSQKIVELGSEFINLHQTSFQILEVHRSNYKSLREIIPQLHQGGESFQSAAKTLDKLQNRVADSSNEWSDLQIYLTQLIENLKNYTECTSSRIDALDNRFARSISNQAEDNEMHLQIINDNISQNIDQLNKIKHENSKK